MSQGFAHEPVMLGEILEVFSGIADGTFLDATLGGAGHSVAVLAAHANVTLLGIDQDDTALAAAASHLDAAGLGGRATLRRARFETVGQVVEGEGIGVVAGALFDLGVSSPQFDVAERGFSYRHDAPLDMRMDRSRGVTAADIVNSADEEHLARIIATNSDERFAGRIARAIVANRPVRGTAHLAEIVTAAIPAATTSWSGSSPVTTSLLAPSSAPASSASRSRAGARSRPIGTSSMQSRLVPVSERARRSAARAARSSRGWHVPPGMAGRARTPIDANPARAAIPASAGGGTSSSLR